METDSDEKQLLNQILNAVKVTPSLNEDLQVEVMKVGLTWLPVVSLGQERTVTMPRPPQLPCLLEHASSLLSLPVVPQNYLDYLTKITAK